MPQKQKPQKPKIKKEPVNRACSQEQQKQDKSRDLSPVKTVQLGNTKAFNKYAQELGINDRQKLFCDIYANDTECRGNGVQAYAKAYNINLAVPGKYNVAKVAACNLLQKPAILSYIKLIFDNTGLNDVDVDLELLFAIKQNSDFGSKVAAIKVYNELKGRIKKQEQKPVNFQINIAANNTGIELNQITGPEQDNAETKDNSKGIED